MPTLPTYVYCSNTDVRATLSRFGVNLRLDDDQDGTVNSVEEANLTEITYDATAEINSYLEGRYSPLHLSESYLVKKWARYFAAKELCERRGNPVPRGLLTAVGAPESQTGIYGRLIRIQHRTESLQSVPERLSPAPAWSNVRVNVGYPLRKVRVERPISEQTPRKGPPPALDYGAEYTPSPL